MKTICMLSFIVFMLVSGVNLWATEPNMNEARVIRSYFTDALDGKQASVIYTLFAGDAEQHFNDYLHNMGVDAIYQNTVSANKIFVTFHTDIHDITVKGKVAYAHITHTGTCINTTVPGFPGGPLTIPTRVGPMLLKGQTLQWQAMARFEFNHHKKIQKEWIVRDELGMMLTAGGTLTFTNIYPNP